MAEHSAPHTHATKPLLTAELIRKYDTRGPRYTSYPTAAQFTEDFNASDYNALLQRISSDAEPLSLYVHIPFCKDICYYCACNKVVTRNKEAGETYLHYLEKEMHLLSQQLGKRRTAVQLHLGGGTPTFLDNGQLTHLIHMLATYFTLTPDEHREYSIEIDPRTVNAESLALLKGLGFNRLSLGVQDFSEEVQQAVNRINPYEMLDGLMTSARDLGFNAINFDLIYGLPKQHCQNLNNTLDKVIALSPERIAFYNYAHLPERFSSQRAIDRLTLPSASEKLAMLQLISEKLNEAAYINIGMDHFVRPDDELAIAQQQGYLTRNFQGYSTSKGTDLIGLGVSSISSGLDYFSQNNKSLDEYYLALDKEELPIERGYHCTSDDLKRRAVIMEMIANLKLNIPQWEQTFAESFSDYFADEIRQLSRMEDDDNLLVITPEAINIQPQGRALLRNICMVFDQYQKSSTQNFSKVI